jgi:hypothetical protein
MSNSADVSFPADLLKDAVEPSVAAALDGERKLFLARRRSQEQSDQQLTKERNLLEQRASTLQNELQLQSKQKELSDQEIEETESMIKRNLAPMARLREAKRTPMTISSRMTEIETEVIRLRQSINEIDQRIVASRDKYTNESLQALQDVRAELGQLKTKRYVSRRITEVLSLDQKPDPGMLLNQADIMTSDENAMMVVGKLGLAGDDSFIAKSRPQSVAIGSLSPQERVRTAVKVIQTHLTAVRTGLGSRIDMSFSWTDPVKAAQIANTAADVYIDSQATAPDSPPSAVADVDSQATAPDSSPGAVIVHRADPPLYRDGPGRFALGIAGLLTGLLAAVVLVSVFEQTRGRAENSVHVGFRATHGSAEKLPSPLWLTWGANYGANDLANRRGGFFPRKRI